MRFRGRGRGVVGVRFRGGGRVAVRFRVGGGWSWGLDQGDSVRLQKL